MSEGGGVRETLWLRADRPEDRHEALRLLRRGGLVAIPTETVYGLAADGLRADAVAAIFAAKGRPADNPLILHVASWEMAEGLARWNEAARRLAQAFWPGPLTLVLEARPGIPDAVRAELPTVALRWPRHAVAQGLIERLGRPLAAPSANLSGRPSPTRPEHVWEDLRGRIDALLDAGPTGVGVESAVVDCASRPPRLLRPGGIGIEALRAKLPGIAPLPRLAPGEAAPSPGMRHRHYAPAVPIWLVEGDPERRGPYLWRVIEEAAAAGEHVGALVSSEAIARRPGPLPEGVSVLSPGSRSRPDAWAAQLFEALRSWERQGVDRIVAELPSEEGSGAAVADRLRRAAERRLLPPG